jgi:hypothetical protein
MTQLVLVEHLTHSQAGIIEESINDGKDHYLSGILMQAEVVNGNGRNYPLAEIKAAVEYTQKKISEGHYIAGELNHPNDLQINLERVSHLITEIRLDGNNAIGKMKLLNTPMGVLAKNLLDGGMKLGVSSRGSGSVVEGKVNGFQFLTVDIVSTPSAPDAYPTSIREHLEGTKQGGKVMTLAEAVVNDPKAQKYLALEIRKFIDALTDR